MIAVALIKGMECLKIYWRGLILKISGKSLDK